MLLLLRLSLLRILVFDYQVFDRKWEILFFLQQCYTSVSFRLVIVCLFTGIQTDDRIVLATVCYFSLPFVLLRVSRSWRRGWRWCPKEGWRSNFLRISLPTPTVTCPLPFKVRHHVSFLASSAENRLGPTNVISLGFILRDQKGPFALIYFTTLHRTSSTRVSFCPLLPL